MSKFRGSKDYTNDNCVNCGRYYYEHNILTNDSALYYDCPNPGRSYYEHNILTNDSALYHDCPNPEKLETWKQDTPQDQAVVILGSIDGWLGNMKEGITQPERAGSFIQENVEQLKILMKWLPKTWT